MQLQITTEKREEIAGQLECGLVCLYNTKTSEIECFSEDGDFIGLEEDAEDIIDKINENYNDYLKFNLMASSEAFQVMESFVGQLPENKIKEKLEQAINQRKPFRQFRNLLDDYPDVLKSWYAFKTQSYMAYVGEIVERYNANESGK